MTKQEFFKALTIELSGLSASEIKKFTEFYSEMIDERVDGGMSEEDAIADLGAPADIAREIMIDIPITKVLKTKIKKKRELKAWQIVCLIIGSPIWISLLAVLFAAVITVYAAIWTVFISFIACDISAIAGGAGITVASIFKLMSMPADSTLSIGLGLCALGMGTFFFLPTLRLAKLFAKISAIITKQIKNIMLGKDNKNESGN